MKTMRIMMQLGLWFAGSVLMAMAMCLRTLRVRQDQLHGVALLRRRLIAIRQIGLWLRLTLVAQWYAASSTLRVRELRSEQLRPVAEKLYVQSLYRLLWKQARSDSRETSETQRTDST